MLHLVHWCPRYRVLVSIHCTSFHTFLQQWSPGTQTLHPPYLTIWWFFKQMHVWKEKWLKWFPWRPRRHKKAGSMTDPATIGIINQSTHLLQSISQSQRVSSHFYHWPHSSMKVLHMEIMLILNHLTSWRNTLVYYMEHHKELDQECGCLWFADPNNCSFYDNCAIQNSK